MSWQRDTIAIGSVGAVAAMAVSTLQGLGIEVPGSVVGWVTLGAGATIAVLRGIVAAVGPDNTTIDERLDRIEDTINDGANQIRGKR